MSEQEKKPEGAFARFERLRRGWLRGKVSWNEYRYADFHRHDDLPGRDPKRADELLAQDRALADYVDAHRWD